MGDPRNLFSGGAEGSSSRWVPTPLTNNERRDKFVQDYGNVFDKDKAYQDSITGYYGGMDYNDLKTNLSKTNTFTKRVPKYRLATAKGGSDDSFFDKLVGNPFVPPDIQFGMLPLTM